jgi:hypothetical protein
MLGKRHIADVNQNIAEPHAAIIAPVSMNDSDYTASPNYHMVMSGFGTARQFVATHQFGRYRSQSGHVARGFADGHKTVDGLPNVAGVASE